ncbi:MAG: class B sortase, LPKTxAVK-specific [Gemella sp.]|nr:class B sortase, LPKTxAVK-specific [Gemella sp.]
MKRAIKNIFSVSVLGILLFITGCSNLPGLSGENDKEQIKTSNIISTGEVGAAYKVSQEEKDYLSKKFNDLSIENEHTVGYIYVPGGNMKEPIVQDKQDTTNAIYLDKAFDGSHAPLLGTVFMDYRNDKSFGDNLTWLFGHARGSGVSDYRMFKDVLSYTKQDFFDAHPYIVVETPERKYYYEALMIHEVHESTELYKTDSNLDAENIDEELENYFSKLSQSNTVFAKKENLVFNPRDKHLILSTCPDFIADPETRYNLYLRQIPDSELNEFLEKNKDKLAFEAK